MSNLYSSVRVLGLLAVFAGLAIAQVGGGGGQLTCSVNAASQPAMRGEGFTEMTADIAILCTGGTVIAPGSPVPLVNISIFYNATVTSRLFGANPNLSEALLLIDEPGSGLVSPGAALPQLLCTTPTTGCQAVAGAGGVALTPGGTQAPNVYQGIASGNTVAFLGVPVLPPGASASRVFRVTNVRVNASALGAGAGFAPVSAFIQVSPFSLALNQGTVNVGFVSSGLSTSVSSAATLSQCASQAKTSVSTLTFAENFGTAFKTRIVAQDNTLYAGQDVAKVFGVTGFPNTGTATTGGFVGNNQNTPGQINNSESNFVFPIGGTNLAGMTDYGTRLKASFNNIPPGATLWVSVNNVNTNASPVAPPTVPGGSAGNIGATSYAQLVQSESVADGVANAFPAIPSTDVGQGIVPIVAVPVVNGIATAVWEVVNTNPNAIESFKFAVYVSYSANQPTLGTTTVNLSYAATALSPAADTTSPLPRFVPDSNAPRNVLNIIGCSGSSLGISKTHTGNFTQGQQIGAAYTVTVSSAAGNPTTFGIVTVTESVPFGMTLASMSGTGWNCATSTCTRSDALSPGTAYPPIAVTVNVASNAASPLLNSVSVSGGGLAGASTTDSTIVGPACTYQLSGNGTFASLAASGAILITTGSTCPWTAFPTATWIHITPPASGTGNGQVIYTIDANPTSTQRTGTIPIADQTFTIVQGGNAAGAGLRFVPVTPCRIADTRSAAGPFGGPSIDASTSRDFNIPASGCGIPANAQAYSLNLTVVPLGPLGFLSAGPAGQGQPGTSTLNSGDGRIKANAAIVPAGPNGAITVFASHPTHVIVDINGYFVPATGNANLAFYPLAPCRIADTRAGTGTFAGPALASNVQRDFPLLSSACGIPATAQAYALNLTVIPAGPLGFLSAGPAGSAPGSSTLNAPTGTIVANAAIVPAGTGGAITLVATGATHLIIDINGYFAPPGSPGGMQFYPVTPCRIADTRGAAGPFGAPQLDVAIPRQFVVADSACGIPANAGAYSLNATVVPPAPLGFLSVWGPGGQPGVSTLNASDGTIVANAAIVPASITATVNALASGATHLILDINGYFAQ
jgi:hypothetical protein